MIEVFQLTRASGAPGILASEHSKEANVTANFASELAGIVRAGEQAAIAGVTGAMPLQQVVETVMHAERTLTTAMSIRDKVVSAYLELTRMQI